MEIEEIVFKFTAISEGFDDVAKKLQKKVGKSVESYKKHLKGLTEQTGKFNSTTFRAMFGAYALSNALTGLYQPVMQAYGIFDMFGFMMMDLFAPVVEVIADVLFGIMDMFMSLPQPVKDFIAVVMILISMVAAIAGMFLFWEIAIAPLTTLIGGLAWPILALIAVIAALFVIWKNWDKIVEFLRGVASKIAEILLGMKDKFMEIFGNILDFAKDFGIKAFNRLRDAFTDIRDKIAEKIGGIRDKIKEIFSDILDRAKNFGKDMIEKIVTGIKNIGHKIAETFWGFIPEPLKNLLEQAGGLFSGLFHHGGFIGGDKGYITKSGLYYEPTGNTNTYSPNISISGVSISNDVDIRDLAEKLNRYMHSEWGRTTMGRGR